jgi:uroporphyrinogen decarboxylase
MPFILPESKKDVKDLLSGLYSHPENDPMTPYTRYKSAVDLRQPDRVPFDFWAVPEAIAELKKYLDVKDDEELLRLLGIDGRTVTPDYIGPAVKELPDGSFYNIWGSHRRKVVNAFSTYEEYAGFPLSDAKIAGDVTNWEGWPRTDYWDWSNLPGKIKDINKDVRYFIRYDIGGIFESSWGLYGLDRFLTGLFENPEIPCAIMDRYTDLFIENVANLMTYSDGLIDIVYTYDDIATQNSLLMSPNVWREFILPRHRRLNDAIKRFGIRILYHSCGAVYPLINDLITDMGIDVLNPLQPGAAGMDMKRIKDEFGKRIAFHGGIDLQKTMPFGSIDDVEHEVRSRCNVLGKGGGYICTTAHYIQADVPVRNVVALYAASRTVD